MKQGSFQRLVKDALIVNGNPGTPCLTEKAVNLLLSKEVGAQKSVDFQSFLNLLVKVAVHLKQQSFETVEFHANSA